MSAPPCFSIIIPVYNVAPYLRECLDSVREQTCVDLECICVDDGSSDGSGLILDEAARRDNRFKIIHQRNVGVAAARNAGLEVAQGQWIAFLDGDDVWAPWTLAECARVAGQDATVDVVAFNTEYFPEKGPYPWPEKFEGCEQRISNLLEFVDSADVSFCFAGKVYRRDVVGSLRFQPLAFGEDILFLLSCCLRAKKQVILDSTFYGYRRRTGSAILSPIGKRRVLDRIEYVTQCLELLETSPRTLGRSLVRGYANGMSETFMHEYVQLPKEDRDEVWQVWKAALPRVLTCRRMSLFQQGRFRFLRLCPLRLLATILCLWPYQLKARGFHR